MAQRLYLLCAICLMPPFPQNRACRRGSSSRNEANRGPWEVRNALPATLSWCFQRMASSLMRVSVGWPC